MKLKALFLIILCSFSNLYTYAINSKVLIIPVRSEISPRTTRIVIKGLAKADSFDAIILNMNTYGGLLADADSIRTAILNCKKPVYVFINKNAASAGALISLACDRIYMQTGSNIGAATVVNQDGDAAPDKYQSYMRGLMRSTAEAQGKDTLENGTIVFKRDPQIAEAMVDENILIEGLSKEGEVITLTTDEAIANNFCDAKVTSINEVLAINGLKGAELSYQTETILDKLIGWLLNPAVRGILIAGIVLGLYFEIQTPGLGIPSLAAVLAAVAYFAPAYLEGLAENWEIVLFLIGLILILLELLVIPGFGFAGITGIIFTVVSLALAMLQNLSFDFSLVGFNSVFLTIAVLFILSMLFGLVLWYNPIEKSNLFSKLVLNSTLENVRVNNNTHLNQLIGQIGIVSNECKPEGKVKINSISYDATSNYGLLTKGANVLVIEIVAGKLVVKSVEKRM